MNELIENINANAIFSGEGMDDLLSSISKEAKSVIQDISTAKNRKAIASMAAKVAKSKTYLDDVGKDMVSEWKTKANAVDSERKKMRDYLDLLKIEVRKPLTDWENEEKTRIETHENNINDMVINSSDIANHWLGTSVEDMELHLKNIESVDVNSFDEYKQRALEIKTQSIEIIKKYIDMRIKHDNEQIELDKLRKEAAERAQKDRDEQIKKEAEERATREVEARLKAESEKAENEKKQAIFEKEEAQRKEKEAIEAAKQATKKEAERIEAEKQAEIEAAKKREANKKHKAKINNAAVKCLLKIGLNEDIAKKVIISIAKNEIENVRISY